MKLHPTQLTTLEPSEEMGRQIMGLRYDLIVPILKGMVDECNRQVASDTEVGRVKLADQLRRMCLSLNDTRYLMNSVAEVCAKYIEEEKNAVSEKGDLENTSGS